MEHRHNVRQDGSRLHLSSIHYGLVQSLCTVLGDLHYFGKAILLNRAAEGTDDFKA